MFERILTTEQLAALGKVVAESARLEPMLDAMLRHITKLSVVQYRAYTKGAMLAKKLEILRVVGAEPLKSDLLRKRLNALVKQLELLNSERVVFVHGIWEEPPRDIAPGNYAEFFGIGKKPSGKGFAVSKKGEGKKITATRLEAAAAEMRTAHDELFEFWSEHWVLPEVRRGLAEWEKDKKATPKT